MREEGGGSLGCRTGVLMRALTRAPVPHVKGTASLIAIALP